jgi:hypothetical protein
MFVSAGMIVGFDQDDVDIFGEQYDFLQEANIPVAMLSVLLAVPKTPLYIRLEAAGRIHNDDDPSRYVGTSGGTNFEPMNMTQDELRTGHEALYRRLYSPAAFEKRVLGTLELFKDVKYAPEPFTLGRFVSGLRIFRHYLRKGKAARRFFLRILARTARLSPRSIKVVMMHLGMYMHFCELHARKTGWNPWAEPAVAEPKPPRATTARELAAVS